MQKKLVGTGGGFGEFSLDELLAVDRSELSYYRRKKLEQLLEQKIDAEWKANGRSSLCWSCQRATWGCLCEWPYKRWPKMAIKQTGVDDRLGEPLVAVVRCPGFWLDGSN